MTPSIINKSYHIEKWSFPVKFLSKLRVHIPQATKDIPIGKCGGALEASQRRAQPDFGGLGWLVGLSWPEIAPSRLVCLAWFGIAI